MTSVARVLLFLTWPIVLPVKTIMENAKMMGPTYIIGILAGYLFTLMFTSPVQWIVFPLVLMVVGILWGHWIAESDEDSTVGKYVSTFAAGFLLALPLHFFLSHLFVGFIFRPFS